MRSARDRINSRKYYFLADSADNAERDIWYDPETLEQHTESFMDLFYKAQNVALETIEDVNKHLYDGNPLTNSLILNNTSYNTGINCDLGQHFTRIRN